MQIPVNYQAIGNSRIAYVREGSGHPLLLLHGFPQTHIAWYKMIPELAKHFTLIIPDLPGYGDSTGPPPDANHESYSKRAMSEILIQLMKNSGFSQFAVAGHDRGGRVAYRMALDHPEKITRLAMLDIIPTGEMAERMTYPAALKMSHWWLLSQPYPFPETLMLQNNEYFLNNLLDNWSGDIPSISREAKNEYLRCFSKPDVIRAMCEDYRAGSSVDLQHDREDRQADRRIRGPVLALWSISGFAADFGDPLHIWEKWAEQVTGHAIDSGHFIMEEAPQIVQEAFLDFFLFSVTVPGNGIYLA
jgi:haloacetate dehalogenase